jgi:hypothetical protein
MSVVNKESVHLMRKILSEKDYTTIAARLINESDVKDMLDIILCLILNGHRDLDNNQARKLMFKVLKRMAVIPQSLFVTGARIPADRHYISAPEFGLASALEGELRGNISPVKILCETRNNIVSCSCEPFS